MSKIMQKFYDIRWALDYIDKKVKYGPWTTPGYTDDCKASKQPRIGFIRARIEARNILTEKTKTIFFCMKDEFLEFRWHRSKSVPLNNKGEIQVIDDYTYGLMLVTTDNKMSFFINGTDKIEYNQEKQFHSLAWI